MKKELNYLVIGAGGTGGCIAAYLTRGASGGNEETGTGDPKAS